MKSLGVTRWDPASRAGAVAVRPRRAHDVQTLRDIADTVNDWADYQKLAGEADNVETSPITGTYDWRSYLQEETDIARRRDAERARREKKVERAPLPPVPVHYYA